MVRPPLNQYTLWLSVSLETGEYDGVTASASGYEIVAPRIIRKAVSDHLDTHAHPTGSGARRLPVRSSLRQ